jgi:hypothetical protein
MLNTIVINVLPILQFLSTNALLIKKIHTDTRQNTFIGIFIPLSSDTLIVIPHNMKLFWNNGFISIRTNTITDFLISLHRIIQLKLMIAPLQDMGRMAR